MFARLCYSLLLLTTMATADVYKSIDEDGHVIYTDNPRSKQQVEKVDLPSINSQPAIPITSSEKTSAPTNQQYHLTITAPVHESHIPPGQSKIAVKVKLQPKMNSEQSIQLLLNGKAFGPASKSPNMTLSNVYRGEHQLAARLQDRKGKTLAQSSPITLYVKRPVQKKTSQ